MVDVVTQIHVTLVALVVLITWVSTAKSFAGGGCFWTVETTSLLVVRSKLTYNFFLGWENGYIKFVPTWVQTYISYRVGKMVTLNEPQVRCTHTFLSRVGEMVTLNEPRVSRQASVSWRLFKPQKINKSIYIKIYNMSFNENKSSKLININIYIPSFITYFHDLIQEHTYIY